MGGKKQIRQPAATESLVEKVLSKKAMMIITILSISFGAYQFILAPSRVNEAQNRASETQIAYLKSELEKNQLLNDTLTKTQQNDLHTLESRMNIQEGKMDDLKTAVVQLQTIINERIPAKK